MVRGTRTNAEKINFFVKFDIEINCKMTRYKISTILIVSLYLISVLLSSCSNERDNMGYHTYKFTGKNDFIFDFFALNLQPESPYIDELHNLNPDVFIVTDLTKSIWDTTDKKYFIKSTITGTVYRCNVTKGTTIRTTPMKE